MADTPKTVPTGILSHPIVDLTTDETHMLLTGILEDDIVLRIPMSVETAMRLLKILQTIQEDKGFPLPSEDVDKNHAH